MQPILYKKWRLSGGILGLSVLLLLLGTAQTSRAIYGAIIAQQNITFNSDGSFVDSFDSADPLESTNGQYDPANPGDDGVVIAAAWDSTISLGNDEIYGPVMTGSYDIGPEGGIGSHAWLSTNSGVEPGYLENGPIYGFPAVTLPYTNGVAPGPGTTVIMLTAGTNIVDTNSPTPPPVTGADQIIASTTNAYYLTNISYPGPMPGLVTNVIFTVTSTNAIVIQITNCSSTQAVYINTNPPPPDICCPGTTPLQMHGNRWYYYPITGITDVTNLTYTFSTNVSYIWEETNYDYQIYQPPTYQTNLYDHMVCGNYCVANLSGLTLVTCPSTVVLTNGLNLTGIGSITIMPGASLSLYVGGGSVTIGSGGINNLSGIDTNLQIYCTPAVHSLSVNTAVPLSAVIIAPDTDITVNGNGVEPLEYSGNVMANSLNVNGVLHFHGDEAVSLPTEPVVTVTVLPSPAFLPAQSNTIVAAGWQVTFNESLSYSGMSFQWFFNATNPIANATNLSLSLSNVTTDMTGEYTLQVSAPGLSLVSQPTWLTVVPSPAPTLDSFSLSASNQFQFNVNVVPGYWYDVEASSNLTDWTPLVFVVRYGTFTFTDTNPLGPQYFYRAGYVPSLPSLPSP